MNQDPKLSHEQSPVGDQDFCIRNSKVLFKVSISQVVENGSKYELTIRGKKRNIWHKRDVQNLRLIFLYSSQISGIFVTNVFKFITNYYERIVDKQKSILTPPENE